LFELEFIREFQSAERSWAASVCKQQPRAELFSSMPFVASQNVGETMDPVKIPEDQIIPMDAVALGVQGLRITFVNVFGITHADGSWTLIDAAIPFTAGMIRSWAEKNFKRAPNAIVLTHGHFDHVSAAHDLAESWNVPVYAHPLEHPYLTGEKEYPKPNVGAGGGIMTLLSPLYPRGPIDLKDRLRALPVGESAGTAAVPELPGWELIHTPGHTPGHVSFFRRSDRTLLAGDAFCTTKPESFFEAALVQQPELHGPPSYFTQDWNQARSSVQRLAGLDPMIVAPGHGKPMAGVDVPEALRQLAARFDEIAVPENKKPAA
jgi:glyoxylase-like metal-dependent hydrolase (beta-lactamase superfamily II)